VIVVHAPAALRTVRTVRRSHLTPAQVHARIAAQMPDDARLQLADYIIYNDDTQLVIPQAWAIYQALIAPK
jgi:dephospho-CoA kinase